MIIPAPFDRYEGEVLLEWIDANDHMNLAYYTVLFDYATDALFDAIGIGRQYKDSTNKGTFVVETHNLYERELLVGDRVRVSTHILATDNKRLHLAHEMFMIASSRRAAYAGTDVPPCRPLDTSRRAVSAQGPRARGRSGIGARPASQAGLGRAPDRHARSSGFRIISLGNEFHCGPAAPPTRAV